MPWLQSPLLSLSRVTSLNLLSHPEGVFCPLQMGVLSFGEIRSDLSKFTHVKGRVGTSHRALDRALTGSRLHPLRFS